MGTNRFQKALIKAKKWEIEVKKYLTKHGWIVVPMGAENILPEVQEAIKRMKKPDGTAKFIKYLPDGFAINVKKEKAFFYDAKNSKSIEKEAYLTYMIFAGKNRNFYLFIKADYYVYIVPIRKLYLKQPKIINEYSLPIDDDGWASPRLWPSEKYLDWKRKYPSASGTAFKYFDFEKMANYKISYSKFIKDIKLEEEVK